MPLYEYQCDACQHRFEVIQRFSDPPKTTCESCGGTVKKLLSSPAIQFKGSGWYITDYARKGGTGATGDTAASSSKTAPDTGKAGTSDATSSTSSTASPTKDGSSS